MRFVLNNFCLLSITILTMAAAFAQESYKPIPPKGASVFFISPKDKAKIKGGTFTVKFGLKGMSIRKAGEDPADQSSGHHHLIIDGSATPTGEIVPADQTHIHFGQGQTETEVTLAPGKHTLTLQFADGAHRSYGPQMSKTISVTVK
jgi:hypothetical protein